MQGGKITETEILCKNSSLSLTFSYLLRFDLIIKLYNQRISIKISSLAEEIIPLINEILQLPHSSFIPVIFFIINIIFSICIIIVIISISITLILLQPRWF